MSPEELTAAFAKAEAGRLHLYSRMTQNGTVANRETFDQAGRKFSEIYYQQKTIDGPRPQTEADLAVTTINLYRYDDQGREVWEGQYSSKKVLLRSLESVRDKNGILHFRQWRDADGIVHYKMLCDKIGHSVGHVYFDKAGKNIIDFRGKVPNGMDASAIPAALLPKPAPKSVPESSGKKSLFKRLFPAEQNKSP